MPSKDFETTTPAQAQVRVDRYILDLVRGCLLLEGEEITLRPKTFFVLRYLTENAGRLVSKDDLFAAVWPNVAITDDVLVQSIGELRRALGEDGPRLVRTVPKRGYRLEATVTSADRPEPDRGFLAPISGEAGADARGPEQSASTFPGGISFNGRYLAALILILAAVLAGGTFWMSQVPGPADRETKGSQPLAQAARLGTEATIAVLPFANLSENDERGYFADGLTQDVISGLGRFSELTVLSWNAVFPSRDRAVSPKETARTLGVRYQVEGSVRQTGDRVRVTAQLVDTREGRVLWSARLDEPRADVFALQDTVTTQIVSSLAFRVSQVERRRVFAKPTENLEAYDYVLRARPALQHPTRANNVEARAFLRRAIDLDPNYAAAYAALADTYHIATALGWSESPSASLSRAEELASKALSLDQSEVRAHITLGRIHIFYQRYDQAADETDRATAINPNNADGLAGRANVLMWTGHTDAAIEAFEHARLIDPDLNTIDRFALSLAYYLKQRYGAAIEQGELNLRTSAGASFSRIVLAAAYAQAGRAEDSERMVRAIRRLDPGFDAQGFGRKFLKSEDIEHLRQGLRKAGLYPGDAIQPPN
jgi:adenylate cyclase